MVLLKRFVPIHGHGDDRSLWPANIRTATAYMGHVEYKHTIKYLKVLDTEHRNRLFSFVTSQKENR